MYSRSTDRVAGSPGSIWTQSSQPPTRTPLPILIIPAALRRSSLLFVIPISNLNPIRRGTPLHRPPLILLILPIQIQNQVLDPLLLRLVFLNMFQRRLREGILRRDLQRFQLMSVNARAKGDLFISTGEDGELDSVGVGGSAGGRFTPYGGGFDVKCGFRGDFSGF
jgi:hypothetical protein